MKNLLIRVMVLMLLLPFVMAFMVEFGKANYESGLRKGEVACKVVLKDMLGGANK